MTSPTPSTPSPSRSVEPVADRPRCSYCGVLIDEHPLTDACAIADESRAMSRNPQGEPRTAEDPVLAALHDAFLDLGPRWRKVEIGEAEDRAAAAALAALRAIESPAHPETAE